MPLTLRTGEGGLKYLWRRKQTMEFSAKDIAALLNGTVDGNEEATVHDLAKIEEGRPGTLTFLSNPAYTEYIYSTKASIAIVDASFEPSEALPETLTLVKVADARSAFGSLLSHYAQMQRPEPGIHPSAVVDPTAEIADSAHVGPQCVIGAQSKIGENAIVQAQVCIGHRVAIGAGTEIHARVSIGNDCKIGDQCTVQAGAIIGADGFGFAPNQENEYQKMVHIGNVILEDHVEIGANTTIDRATLGSTIIRKGVKLDNLIQVAHNVEIGENTVIAAQTGIAGSTKIGKNCMIGGQVGIIGHLSIADEVKIAAQSGIGQSITKKGAIVQGSPALPIGDFKRAYVHFRKLGQMAEQLDQLSKNTSIKP